MHFSNLVFLSLAALTPLVTATGHAKVTNNCAAPVYLWSVGGSVGERQTIQPGQTYSETFHHDPSSGGIALKITRTPNGLYDGSPQLSYQYTLDPTQVWYDLANTFGAPFSGNVVTLHSDNAKCPGICWSNGVSPGGNQVKTCEPESDKELVLCAAGC
ncbi:hypothetical protein P175DRAFT_0436731 [Aspergillus ochraceoroseus IBT 24754]|uniref:BYS1 domain protein n=3 Tax=Aspergillus subgen. Nidulantes TaxID=2720870 RepID=A0A0F8UU85_9EURO|nr:uncharacterized protein P175DRAFT_0436731 [Aspergillus ochraceoroseus IBT 24754]KKK18748.1 hypothetical protein AOCH_000594 [Aspergillus ochraceoroseus]KKK23043.1 hypothetical protein ARAM_006419 [Aspergillus rambellii]PTU21195.1 hypothetical protein P175DRAFT_0436731 [Aspergillus ochraceoroseus IBT 24754]